MKKINKLILIIFILGASLAQAQEKLIDLTSNPGLKKAKLLLKKNKKSSDTLNLPFFDDFSFSEIIPADSLWENDSVFVNSDYVKSTLYNSSYTANPPSIGVATFDALDPDGNVYTYLIPDVPTVADYLTSKPINLLYNSSDSIYISFSYQPKGIGNPPENTDSLVLEFFNPTSGIWHWAWSTPGSSDNTFKKAIVPIRSADFLKKGFRFRFKNYVSLGSNYEPSWLSNCDIWNLDYIKLDKNRNYQDTVYKDIAMLSFSKSILKDYKSIPWRHLSHVNSEFETSMKFEYKSNCADTNVQAGRNFLIADLKGNGTPFAYTNIDVQNVEPYSTFPYSVSYSYLYNSDVSDSAEFQITAYLNTANFVSDKIYRWNDTTRYIQKFYNYYSYDDGTSEAGYGLSGEGAQNGKFAYKFTCLKTDTLRGIQIFFNNTQDDYTAEKYFYLTVWKNSVNNTPGDTLISQIGEHPYFDGLNEFHLYKFNRDIIIDSGMVYYVGVIQTTDDLLNVGWDKNSLAEEKLYYNISGTWLASSFEGALMMRPMFGKKLPDYTGINPLTETQIKIYPNPAQNILFVEGVQKPALIEFFDITGRKVKSMQPAANSISVADLPNGIYLMKCIENNKQYINRVIISR